MKLKHVLLAGLAAFALAGPAAHAQSTTGPLVQKVDPADSIQVIKRNVGIIGNQYATAAQINGVIGYLNEGVLATAQSLTFGNSTQEILAQSSATIGAVTLTASANPGDGQLNCYYNTQITTAITWNANTTVNPAQTISGAPTAGVAKTKYCMIYVASLSEWLPAQ